MARNAGHSNDASGHAGNVHSSFDYRPTSYDVSSLKVASVTTLDTSITIAIANNQIPQPDTIAIRFNKPLDAYTMNSSTIQLWRQVATAAANGIGSAGSRLSATTRGAAAVRINLATLRPDNGQRTNRVPMGPLGRRRHD